MLLTKLRYHKKWLHYNFLSPPILAQQNAQFDRGDDPHPEHYRYQSFLHWLQAHPQFTDQDLEHFLELVALDRQKNVEKKLKAKSVSLFL